MITLRTVSKPVEWVEDTVRHLGYEPGRAIHRIGKAVARVLHTAPWTEFKIEDEMTGQSCHFHAHTFEPNLDLILDWLGEAQEGFYGRLSKRNGILSLTQDPITLLEDFIKSHASHLPPVFVDMDDVVADFSGGFCRKFRKHHVVSGRAVMWNLIDTDDTFYETLPAAFGAGRLIEAVSKIPNHAFLSSSRTQGIAGQKERWLRERSEDARFIGVLPNENGTFDKSTWATQGAVLVDDYGHNIQQWEAAGGIGVHHYSCYATAYRLLAILRAGVFAKPEQPVEAETAV